MKEDLSQPSSDKNIELNTTINNNDKIIIESPNDIYHNSIIRMNHSDALDSFHSNYNNTETTDNNNNKPQISKIARKIQRKSQSTFCSTVFILPFSLIIISIITFLSVFLTNYLTSIQTGKDLNYLLAQSISYKIQEKLNERTSIPPKVISYLQEMQKIINFTNDMQQITKPMMKELYLNFPEVSTLTIANEETQEQLFFERLPNGTTYEGFRLPDKPYNISKLFRYVIDGKTLERIPDWGPVIIVNNYYTRQRDWYSQCKYKIDYWSTLTVYTSGQIAFYRCSSLFENFKNTTSKLLGVATADFTLGNLGVFLKSFVVGKSGLSFVIERSNNGLLIASSNGNFSAVGSFLARVNVDNTTIREVREIGLSVLNEYGGSFGNVNISSLGVEKYIFVKGKEYIVYILPFYLSSNIDWLIFVAFPASDYLTTLEKGKAVILYITCIMILFSIIISLILGICIKWPLHKLKKQMRLVTNLNLESLLRNKNFNVLYEVKAIQNTFRSMVCALESFKKFVPEVIIKRSLKKKKVAEMYLTEKNMTIFFMDFVDFTKLTESLQPIKLIELIGEAIEEMSLIIEGEGGIIDKYIGDAIMALFNVPILLENHQVKACYSVLKCIKQLERKQLEWNNRGLPSIKCRIGVHSGKALVGNFGSSKRLNFTAIGHNVNLAARLEPLCKLYETNNLISDITYNYVKDKFCCKFIDIVVVKGTSGTVVVYTLLEERESASVSQLEIEKISFELRDCLIDNQLKDATNKISEALKLEGYNSKDRSLQIIRERCERFYENEKGFTGVLTLTEKSF